MHRWPMWSGRDLPRPAPRQRHRAGVRLSFAGRSAAFRRRRFRPALLREAPRCSCLAVACGDRGVSHSTWAAGLLFGADGVAVTVSVDRTARDASLATATTSSATTVSASMQDAFSVPSCPASSPNVSRGRRLPYAMSTTPAIGRLAHPVDPPPPLVDRAAWRIRAHAGASPARKSTILAYRATAVRHLGVAIHELWMPRPHRISTGCLVSQSVGMAPDHAATGRLPHGRYDSASTKAAPELSSYHPCRCCAPGRFSAPSLPDCPTGRHAAEGAFGRSRPPAGSDGPCASDRPPDGHHHGADYRLVGAGHLHVGPAGVRRALHA